MNYTASELPEIQRTIETATLISRARFEEEMRAVDILTARAAAAEPKEAKALLEAAREVLKLGQ